MALTDLQKQKIKNWAREVLRYMTDMPRDTVPVRILLNRAKLLPHFIERDNIDAIKDELPVGAKAFAIELIRLLKEYEHYFDTGYRSAEIIDDLPDKIMFMLAKIMKAEL